MHINQSDQHCLQQIMDAALSLSQATPECMIAIKSIDSKHCFCSSYWANEMAMTQEEIIGAIVCDRAYDHDPDIETHIVTEDQWVIEHQKPMMTLKILQTQKGIQPYYCLKSPIINPDSNNSVGILCQGFHISHHNFSHVMQAQRIPTSSQHLPELTKREKEVIFLFLSHLNSQAIADTLGEIENKTLTKSTIDSLFLEKLYPKFNVYSRPALFKTLLELGYTTRIPKELLSVKSILLSPTEVY